MLGDALFVFAEVVGYLVLAVAVLWLIAKVLGYVASLSEGEPLVPTIRADIESTLRELRLLRPASRRERAVPPMPTAG